MRNKVLIIEDDILLANSLSANLNNVGVETVVSNIANDGLNIALNDSDIALIFLDYIMPEKNGLEVLDTLKKHEETKDIPVVFLTNVDDEEIKSIGRDKGAFEYLVKSNISVDTVIDITGRYIELPEIEINGNIKD